MYHIIYNRFLYFYFLTVVFYSGISSIPFWPNSLLLGSLYLIFIFCDRLKLLSSVGIFMLIEKYFFRLYVKCNLLLAISLLEQVLTQRSLQIRRLVDLSLIFPRSFLRCLCLLDLIWHYIIFVLFFLMKSF
ncbi:hypothetical protein ACH5RR_033031 [Cinchona calisaya]|uniref:Uncharacterized protein n=1 Tax=Cinchona calisaya TaxID=153742 RepID=A0ABD2YM57_9GENT